MISWSIENFRPGGELNSKIPSPRLAARRMRWGWRTSNPSVSSGSRPSLPEAPTGGNPFSFRLASIVFQRTWSIATGSVASSKALFSQVHSGRELTAFPGSSTVHRAQELFVGFAGRGGQRSRGDGRGVLALAPRRPVKTVETSRRRKQERDGAGMLDPERIVLHYDGALAGVRAQVAFELHPLAIIGRGINDGVGAIVVVRVGVRRSLAAKDQDVVLGLGAEMEPASQPGRETKSSRPACREANNQDLVGLRDADLRQGLECLWVVTVLAATRPERVLVEGDPLGRHAAVNHAAQAAVAHRHRLEPCSGWPRIPKAQELVRRIRPTAVNRIGGLNPGRQQQ